MLQRICFDQQSGRYNDRNSVECIFETVTIERFKANFSSILNRVGSNGVLFPYVFV